jgi:6-phosphogluconolactonase
VSGWGKDERCGRGPLVFATAVAFVALACGGHAVKQRHDADDDADVVPTDVAPRLYAVNYGSRDISAFDLDPATGALTSLTGSPFPTSYSSIAVAAAPAHTHLYLADSGVSTFAIERKTGALTFMGRAQSGDEDLTPNALAAHPGGKFVYASNCGADAAGSLAVFAVDASNGLRRQPGRSVPTQYCPGGIAITASGRFLYIASQYAYDGDLQGFSIDPKSGALTPLPGSPFESFLAVTLAIDPSGQYLYASDQEGWVRSYSIDAQGGLRNLDTKTPTGGNPFTMTMDRTGQRLFVANWSDETLSSYAIDPATGEPLEVAGSPFAVGPEPHVETVDATSSFVYVTNQDESGIKAFAIGAAGELTEVASSPFPAGMLPTAAVALP